MPGTRLFDERIKETLEKISEPIDASEALGLRVRHAIDNGTKKENSLMKKHFTLKHAAILSAVLCLATVTVLASGHIKSYVLHSSSTPTFTSYPTDKELKKELGFTPTIVETFSNGYSFDSAVIGETSALNEDDSVAGTSKFLRCTYADQGENLSLSIARQLPGETADPKATPSDYNGITLSYLSQKYKFVPPDYELTEEDKKAEESGEVVFSYGSDTVENKVVQSVSWTEDELGYTLMAFDSELSQDDFTAMAAEVIDAGK